jgi:V8-like Glu-specific endopeptidase
MPPLRHIERLSKFFCSYEKLIGAFITKMSPIFLIHFETGSMTELCAADFEWDLSLSIYLTTHKKILCVRNILEIKNPLDYDHALQGDIVKKVFLATTMLSFALGACTNSSKNDFSAKQSDAIFNGEITTPENPIKKTTVFLYMRDGDGFATCSGSVLSSTVILTAAHCVTVDDTKDADANPPIIVDQNNIVVMDGDKVTATQNVAIVATVDKIVVSPNYMRPKNNSPLHRSDSDIALVKLKIPLPDSYKPARLASSIDELFKNQMAIAGYGLFSEDNRNGDYRMRNGTVTLKKDVSYSIPMKKDDTNRVPSFVANTDFAYHLAYQRTNDSGICHGDSGGPLYYQKDGEIYLAGVNVMVFQDGNCATNEVELATSLMGPRRQFVLQTFKDLTGSYLNGEQPVAPESNSKAFEYYFSSPATPNKNQYVDFTDIVLGIDTDNTIALVTNAADLCKDTSKAQAGAVALIVSPLMETTLETKETFEMATIANGQLSMVLDGRLIKKDDKTARAVALTPDGYVAADIPIVDCRK